MPAACGIIPAMEHGKCYPIAECLSIWAVIKRWPHAPLYEIERLNNDPDGLTPYEIEIPSSGTPDKETMYLHPMRRGELRFVRVHEFHQEVRDARNRPVASDCGKETVDENGDPMLQDFLWFLLGDVLHLEKENPDYIKAIQQCGRREPAVTPPRPAQAEPARSAERMLHAKEAAALLGCSKSHFWALAQRGEIPKGIRLSAKSTVWHEDDIMAYVRRHETTARPWQK